MVSFFSNADPDLQALGLKPTLKQVVTLSVGLPVIGAILVRCQIGIELFKKERHDGMAVFSLRKQNPVAVLGESLKITTVIILNNPKERLQVRKHVTHGLLYSLESQMEMRKG